MNQRVIPFLVGLAVGHFGLRWIYHAAYCVMIIAAYALGHHFALK